MTTEILDDLFVIEKNKQCKASKKFKGFYFEPEMIDQIKDKADELNMTESEFAEKVFELALEHLKKNKTIKKQNINDRKQYLFYLDHEQDEKLSELTTKTNRDRSEIVRIAIDYLYKNVEIG
ncbi:MAG: ribbon-helix-helix protein, CopG family [Candidatus Woesearchaeota archaeon]